MKKKSEIPITISDLLKATSSFTKQTDRGTALVVAAWVDDAMLTALIVIFHRDEKLAKRLLQIDGPLGSFAARISVAYLLDVITPSLFHDLEVIRAIRNKFAHVRESLRFTSQPIKDRCKSLAGAMYYEIGTGEKIRSPRERFLISSFLATHYLLSYSKLKKPPKPRQLDLYGITIKQMARSKVLEHILETIRKDPRAA
jgi:hypothetical protein